MANRNKAKRILTIMLCMSLLTAMMPSNVFADSTAMTAAENAPATIVYTDADNDLMIQVTMADNDNINVIVNFQGEEAVGALINNEYYLNGEYVDTAVVKQIAGISGLELDGTNPKELFSTSFFETNTSGIKWGDWSKARQKTFNIYKLAAAGILAIIAAYLMGNGFFIVGAISSVASIAASMDYDRMKISAKMRLGYNSTTKYNYAQEKITFYGKRGSNSYEKIDTVTATQKKSDK